MRGPLSIYIFITYLLYANKKVGLLISQTPLCGQISTWNPAWKCLTIKFQRSSSIVSEIQGVPIKSDPYSVSSLFP